MYNPNPIKKNKMEQGFSLLELAIVMVLIGLVVAPAISMYHNNRIKTDWQGTEDNIETNVDELGRFRSVFGRYPCPASRTAVPGDLNYGHEDCTVHPFGTCVGGTCTFTSNIVGQQVLTGTIPFKTLNLQESESYDRYLNRLSYAVTLELTDGTTFDLQGGGIGIIDKSPTPTSIIDPPDRAHFIVISHGHNQIGGTTKAGVLSAACVTGTLFEQENCDIDATFLSGEIEDDFDDRIGFFSGIALSEWQTYANFPDDIHLKNASNISIGATTATDLSSSDQASARTFGAGSGTIIASDANAPNEGRFYSDTLCEYDATILTTNSECFKSRLFAGALTPDPTGPTPTRFEAVTDLGSGMSCYIPGVKDEYLVGIENRGPICEDEIYISCPTGAFIAGINSNGEVICEGAPNTRCDPQSITKTCGGTELLPDTADGVYEYAYSGECRKITDYNAAYFTTAMAGFTTLGEVTALIATINAEPRTNISCGPNASNSQIRDVYKCNSGTWNKIRTHEKRYPWSSFPGSTAGGTWNAETGYTGNDTSNNVYNHDCWCREDYRINTYSCYGGLSGTRVVIRKHRCPQTQHYWHTVLNSSALCGCAPYTLSTTQSCNSWYDETNGTTGTTGLTGTVYHTFDVTCSGDTPVVPPTPTTTNADACACPANPDTITRDYCLGNFTNSWTSIYGQETGVADIHKTTWNCPGTITGGLPDPGSTGTTTSYSPENSPVPPACTCDNTLTAEVILTCDAGLEGLGMKYRKEWDCLKGPTGDWEDQDDWDLLEDNCHPCSWQGSGAPTSEEFPYGGSAHRVGKVCTCGDSPANQCWDYGSPYDIWTNCPCVVQIE